MKCLQLHSRILFVSAVLAGSPPTDNLMNLKLTAENQWEAILLIKLQSTDAPVHMSTQKHTGIFHVLMDCREGFDQINLFSILLSKCHGELQKNSLQK